MDQQLTQPKQQNHEAKDQKIPAEKGVNNQKNNEEGKEKEKKKKKKDKRKDKKGKDEGNEQGKEQIQAEKVENQQVKDQQKQAIQELPQIKNNPSISAIPQHQTTQQDQTPTDSTIAQAATSSQPPLQQGGESNQNEQALKAVESINQTATQQVNEEQKRIQSLQQQSSGQQPQQKQQQKPSEQLATELKQTEKNAKKKSSTATKEGTSKKANKDKEQLAELQLLLKEKLKEVKTLSSKNSKLEAKYMDLFKENKSIKKDSSHLVQCMLAFAEGLLTHPEQVETDKANIQHLKQSVKDLQGILKSSSPSKQDLIVKCKHAWSTKMAIELQAKENMHGKMMKEVEEQNLKAIQKQLLEHSLKADELKKANSAQQQKLKLTISQLQSELQAAKSKHSKQLSTLTQSHSQSLAQLKQDLKRQLLQSSSTQLQQLSSIHEQQLKSLYDQLQKAKQKHKDDSETISEMDEKLDAKNAQVSRLMKEKLKLQHQINQLKVKTFRDELEETESFERKQEESINERNEFLKIRQELEAMIQKRDQFKAQISKLQNQLQKAKHTTQTKDHQIEELLNQLTILQRQRNQTFTRHSMHPEPKQPAKQPQPQIPQQIQIKSSEQLPPASQPRKSSNTVEQRQTLQQQREEYLRNVFIRYLKSILTQNQSSQTLLRVILTMLKVPQRDKKELQQLLNSKKKWWIF